MSLARLLEIIAIDFHVDGLLRAEAGDPFDQPARIEEHRDARKECQDLRTYFVHDIDLVSGTFVRRDKIDGDDRRMGAGVRVEERGAALSEHARTGYDGVQFLRRDLARSTRSTSATCCSVFSTR